MRTVADHAGVSVATVSFVLSGRPSGRTAASSQTAERVRATAEALGYRPNNAARAVRTGRSGLVLLSLTHLSDPWCHSLSRAVSTAAASRHLQPLILADGDWGEVLESQPVDVAFLDTATVDDLDQIRRLVGRGLRVIVHSDDLEPDGFDVIRSPQRPGCELAMHHLLQQHTRIGCLSSVNSSKPGWHREQAYLEAMDAAGIRPAPGDIQRYPRDQGGVYEAALRLLDRPDRPTAIFASSDLVAITAINVALRLGLSVPDDLAVIGVGNTEEGASMQPSLTSVGPSDFFNSLAELIVAVADRPADHPPTGHDFPWTVHLRESTRIG